MSQTPFSFSFFSTLAGNSEISPHYGPCNLRIRCHFPLIVPSGDCGMEIAGIKVLSTNNIANFDDNVIYFFYEG
jgi:aspartate beta-hydroxylase